MAWVEPKVDWKPEDWFNIEDYNRIKNNIDEVFQIAVLLYPNTKILDMGTDKKYEDYYYAEDFNTFEENLERIRNAVFPFDIGEKKVFYANQSFIDAQELNRVERATKLMYENLSGQRDGRYRLAFMLGRRSFQ